MDETSIRQLFDAHRNTTYLKGSESFNTLVSILVHHPTWKDRIDDIKAIRVFYRGGRNLLKIRTNIRWFSISWKACIARKRKCIRRDARPAPLKQLHEALRTSIRCQMRAWRRGKPHVCSHCHHIGKVDVDHLFPTFKSIRDSFLETQPPEIWPTQFGYGKNCASAFLPEDIVFQRRFQRYHADKATYQLLCRTCNLRKGTLNVTEGASYPPSSS